MFQRSIALLWSSGSSAEMFNRNPFYQTLKQSFYSFELDVDVLCNVELWNRVAKAIIFSCSQPQDNIKY